MADLVSSYEQLRDRVVAGQPDGWRLGHGLLVGKGMVAWFGVCATFAPAPVAGTAAPELASTSSTVSPSTNTAHPSALPSLPNAGQLVAVLTQMTLAHT